MIDLDIKEKTTLCLTISAYWNYSTTRDLTLTNIKVAKYRKHHH